MQNLDATCRDEVEDERRHVLARHEVGQPRGVDLARRLLLIGLRPGREGEGVVIALPGADAPLVDQAPGLAALRGRLRHDEEPALLEEALPQVLLLRRREQQRE